MTQNTEDSPVTTSAWQQPKKAAIYFAFSP
jgi:hypothetical protein